MLKLKRPKQQQSLPLLMPDGPKDSFLAISLFSGAGGLDLGLERASPNTIRFCAWVEKDPDCQRTLLENYPDAGKALFGDIAAVSPSDLLRATGLERGQAFLVAGGPPCQAFSTAGLRQSIHDDRGQVAAHYFNIIKTIRPRFFVFENVRGLLSVAIKHRGYEERIISEKLDPGEPNLAPEERLGSVFQQVVLPGFERLGYELVYGLVNAADYGTAQIRHRVIFLGSRDREFGSGRFRKTTGRQMTVQDLLPPTHHEFSPYDPIRPWRTLRDAIGHLADTLPARDESFTYSAARKEIWRRIPPGNYWVYIRDHPELFPEGLKSLLKGAYDAGGGKVGMWRRLCWEKPAPTLPTQPQHLATGLCHPEQERPLSVPEYAALQDFPPDYRFVGTKASMYRQIGNAVPVRLGQAIGSLLLAVSSCSRLGPSDDSLALAD